ncbi:MAG: hypothetical protein C0462_10845 [Alcanivorax sp.]|nr:hypothetical protein [Alcanivorax sp.]
MLATRQAPIASLLFLSGAALSSAHGSAPMPYIYGGEDAQPGDWPWVALITSVDPADSGSGPTVSAFSCSGVLIDDDHVLTAAHCFFNGANEQATEVYIAYNRVARPDTLDDYDTRAQTIYIHEQYNEFSGSDFRNDIAIIRLTHAANLSSYPQLASTADISTLEGLEGDERLNSTTALGWGDTGDTAGVTAGTLQQVMLDYVRSSDCHDKWGNTFTFDMMICADGTNPARDTCGGDSGGPLLTGDQDNPVIVGLTSFGSAVACGQPGNPGVYTNVAYYAQTTSWIDDVRNGLITPRPPRSGPPQTPRVGSSGGGGAAGLGLLWLLPLLAARRQSRRASRSAR